MVATKPDEGCQQYQRWEEANTDAEHHKGGGCWPHGIFLLIGDEESVIEDADSQCHRQCTPIRVEHTERGDDEKEYAAHHTRSLSHQVAAVVHLQHAVGCEQSQGETTPQNGQSPCPCHPCADCHNERHCQGGVAFGNAFAERVRHKEGLELMSYFCLRHIAGLW